MHNLLSRDGTAIYYGPVFSAEDSDRYLRHLLDDINWDHDRLMLFGRHIVTKRKVAWYAEYPFEYTYSNSTKRALEWTPALRDIKDVVETCTGSTYNCCLLNLYHDGSEGMGWHSDDEKEIQPRGSISSVSFGAERDFFLKHKVSGEKITVYLENGSVLDMKDEIQDHWLHQLPVRKRIKEPRINLTFRHFIG